MATCVKPTCTCIMPTSITLYLFVLQYASLHNAYLGYFELCLLGLWLLVLCFFPLCLVCYTYLRFTSLLYAYFSYVSLHYDYLPLEFFSNCWPPVTGLVLDVSTTHLAKCLFKLLYCRVCGLSMEMTRGTPRNLLPLL